jgi:hypothetical protein
MGRFKSSNANAVGKVVALVVIFVGVYVLVVTTVWWQVNLSDIEITLWLIPSAIMPIAALVYYAKSS